MVPVPVQYDTLYEVRVPRYGSVPGAARGTGTTGIIPVQGTVPGTVLGTYHTVGIGRHEVLTCQLSPLGYSTVYFVVRNCNCEL